MRNWAEALAARLLAKAGFTDVVFNTVQRSHPYAGILATYSGQRYLFSVKARDRFFKHGAVRSSYEISSQNIIFAAKKADAIPAWLIVQVDRRHNTFSAYWGIMSDLPDNDRSDNKLSISVLDHAVSHYHCLALNESDDQITEIF